jgi:kumamolisin
MLYFAPCSPRLHSVVEQIFSIAFRRNKRMKRFTAILAVTSIIGMSCVFGTVFSQGQSGQGAAHADEHSILVPDSTVESPDDVGLRAHTNHLIRIGEPQGGLGPGGGMTPAQLRAFYGLASSGGSGLVVIVDAFDYPTALNDFNVFSAQFGLPQETSTNPLAPTNTVFQVVYASGSKPRGNCGWGQEAALDIEWAHAMAPSAKIVLVEAATNSFANLFAAVDVASTLAGAKQVSMSWGGSEFSSEASNDVHFTSTSGVVFFASSGDTGGTTIYPSASPYVVAAGGTSVKTNTSGVFVSESGWSGSGGGPSKYESRPSYQSGIASIVGAARGIPDVSSDADPNTGVSVYDSTRCQGLSGWLVFGGTSVSSPCLAGMENLSGHSYTDSSALLTNTYSKLGTASFRDILTGTAGSFSCTAGWDFVTGVGSPQGTSGL